VFKAGLLGHLEESFGQSPDAVAGSCSSQIYEDGAADNEGKEVKKEIEEQNFFPFVDKVTFFCATERI